jgi:peptide/nickel transport system substrate-binding protein
MSAAPESTAVAQTPQTFVRVYLNMPTNVDPHGPGFDNAIYPFLRNMYQPLVDYDQQTFKLRPVLATAWDTSADGLRYTFTLRRGVKFHDGTVLTSGAVKLSAERVLHLGFVRARMLRAVDRIETPDEFTVRFVMKERDGTFLSRVVALLIASAKALNERPDAWFQMNEDGTGPYILETFDQGAGRASFVSFPDYWDGWHGRHLMRIEHQVVPESSTQRLLLERGQAHWMTRTPIEYVFDLQNSPVVQPVSFRSVRISYLPLNTARGMLTDKRLRQALVYAFPYSLLRVGYYHNLAVPAAGPLHSRMLNDPTLHPVEQDLDKAKKLLAEAGYATGGFTLTYTYPTGGEEQKIPGVLLQDALRKLNIRLELNEIPFANIIQLVSKLETTPDVMTLINSPITGDPGVGVLESLFDSVNAGSFYNWGWYKNPRVDALLATAAGTVDERARLDLYRQVQRIVIDDAAGVFLTFPDRWAIINRKLKGYTFAPIGLEWDDWYHMYFQ